MAERLGASYTMKGTRTQDPTSHYQVRPNSSMASGLVGSPTGSLGGTGMVPSPRPIKGGGTGGALQPVTPRPPRNGGSGPIFQNPRPVGGGMVGGPGGTKYPGTPTKQPAPGGGLVPGAAAHASGVKAPSKGMIRPIQANTGTGSTKAPLARSLGKGGAATMQPKLPTPGGLTARKR